MRTLRILVLLLVCVLLPFRGAVAATLLCADAERTGAAGPAHAHHGTHVDTHEAAGAAHAHAHDHGDAAGADSPGAEGSPGSDGCNICASGCHAAAMVAAAPVAPAALPAAATVFPTLRVPAPDFESDGLDRPPRSR